MHIGVDFDNTIVCYDALFHKVAREKNLIPAGVPVNKSDVRNYLRGIGNEDEWTQMQGCVYGARMAEAAPYPGVIEFFKAARAAGIRVSIISHKTRHPFLGEPYDLHQAATCWLEQQGFFDGDRIGLSRERVFFELTKETKLQRIAQCGCTHFIDDLPEFLGEPAFPAKGQRILFDANNLYVAEHRFLRIQTWEQARNLLLTNLGRSPAPSPRAAGGESWGEEERHHSTTGTPRPARQGEGEVAKEGSPQDTIEPESLHERALPFVRQHGIAGEFVLEPLPGGANNRVYRLRADEGDRVLKVYFHDPADMRDRFRAERAFYTYLWSHSVRRTPEPFGWDSQHRFGLLGFVAGRKLQPDEVNEGMVSQALEFIVEANRSRPTTQTEAMPIASEACFSIADHLECVQRRMARLQTIEPGTETHALAVAFVRNELNPVWEKIHASISAHAGRTLNELQADRCLSPSDFGFHNALLPPDGQLRFFDFEYAGWDDPAKLVCDFFCQPQLAVGPQHWDAFLAPLAGALRGGASLGQRARLLLPAYQIKWCCIMLNDFIPSEQARRRFALGDRGTEDRKRAQLAKGRQALQHALQVWSCHS